MNELKQLLSKFEEEFYLYKKKIEKLHLLIIFIYFVPPLILLGVLLNTDFQPIIKNSIKTIIMFVVIIGFVLHFFFRFYYYKNKKRFKKYINKKLNDIYFTVQNNSNLELQNDETFKENTVDAARNIFKDREMDFNNKNIRGSLFWYLVFLNLEIEIELSK